MSVYEPIDRKQRKVNEELSYECRATRHWMARQAFAPSDWKPAGLYIGAKYVIHLECARCGTWRHVAIDHTGHILASRYEWPDWYRRPGEGRLTGDQLRLWQATQARKAEDAMSNDDDKPSRDPGIALSIFFPLRLGPDERNPGGIVLMAWASDTGEILFERKLATNELPDNTPGVLMEKLTRLIPSILLSAYDGDDGELLTSAVIAVADAMASSKVDESGIPSAMAEVLAEAKGDPDKPCPLCDETFPEGEHYDRHKAHRECLLANAIGPLGHHLDHDFWCRNMGDGDCGLGARVANLDLAALVDRYGLPAVVAGNFPKDEVPTVGRREPS